MSEILHLTAHEAITVRRTDPDALVVEVAYDPGGSPPPPHLHPEQDERFEIVSGRLTVKVDGREQVLEAGDVLEIPRGTVHQMWNAGDAPARCVWETRPAGRTLDWWRRLDAAGPKPSLPRMAALITEFSDVFVLAQRPRAVVRPALAALARLDRAA